MVIQFPSVTLCFAPKVISTCNLHTLPISNVLNSSSYLKYKLQIQSTKVGESYWHGSVSMD